MYALDTVLGQAWGRHALPGVHFPGGSFPGGRTEQIISTGRYERQRDT